MLRKGDVKKKKRLDLYRAEVLERRALVPEDKHAGAGALFWGVRDLICDPGSSKRAPQVQETDSTPMESPGL